MVLSLFDGTSTQIKHARTPGLERNCSASAGDAPRWPGARSIEYPERHTTSADTRTNGRTGELKGLQAGRSETPAVQRPPRPPPRVRSFAGTGAPQLIEIPSTAVSTWGGAAVFLNVLLTRLGVPIPAVPMLLFAG